MFNATAFLEHHFQSRQGLIRMLQGYGLEAPRYGVVDKWWCRGSVSSPWLATLLVVLELEHGRPASLTPFIDLGEIRHERRRH